MAITDFPVSVLEFQQNCGQNDSVSHVFSKNARSRLWTLCKPSPDESQMKVIASIDMTRAEAGIHRPWVACNALTKWSEPPSMLWTLISILLLSGCPGTRALDLWFPTQVKYCVWSQCCVSTSQELLTSDARLLSFRHEFFYCAKSGICEVCQKRLSNAKARWMVSHIMTDELCKVDWKCTKKWMYQWIPLMLFIVFQPSKFPCVLCSEFSCWHEMMQIAVQEWSMIIIKIPFIHLTH